MLRALSGSDQTLTLWLQGGLGNQLFQLNGAAELAKADGRELRISRASFLRDPLRDYALSPLESHRQRLSWGQELFLGWPFKGDGSRRDHLWPSKKPVVWVDDTDSSDLPPQAVVVGFFQRPKDLGAETDLVTSELVAVREKLPRDSHAARVEQGVMAHVRRTDYVSSDAAASRFGRLTKDYYMAGLEALSASLAEVMFFTDDVDFVMTEFGVPRDQVVGPDDTGNDFDALLLMSRAARLIIANSSFSWWAAETAGSDAQVVLPRQWFRDDDSENFFARSDWALVDND